MLSMATLNRLTPAFNQAQFRQKERIVKSRPSSLGSSLWPSLPRSPPCEATSRQSTTRRRLRPSASGEGAKPPKTQQSSWDAKDAEGKDYLYRLGNESDNLRITVGAKSGMIDDLFTGKFLGQDADIVMKYRVQYTRSFEHLQGEYYIAPSFLDRVVIFLAKNYLTEQINAKVPLILGIWGGKGQGKTFQVELIFRLLGVVPVVLSAGELESEWAGEPGKLIRERYRTASAVIKNQGKMSCLVINDLDAGCGMFGNTQNTVNTQVVMGTLMNLCDNPERVSTGQEWLERDIVNRVPIIITGNDLSTLYAPLIRDGRMEKYYWQPTRDDIVRIVHHMYKKDGMTEGDIGEIVDTFPGQALDFYGALRSRTMDDIIRDWVKGIGGPEKIGKKLINPPKDEPPPVFYPPQQSVSTLIEAGYDLMKEQEFVNSMRLSDEYMKKQEQSSSGGLSFG